MNTLAILGASGFGKQVADIALCAGWQNIVFYDDRWPAYKESGRWSVCGDTEKLFEEGGQYSGIFVAIGNCAVRINKFRELHHAGFALPAIIHPMAYVSRFARIGDGTIIMPCAVVSVDVTVGTACIINNGASVSHDCVLGDGVHISPGARLGGYVSVGDRSWVGIGSAVRQEITIGADSIVGAGSAVVKSVQDNTTVVGNPARPLK